MSTDTNEKTTTEQDKTQTTTTATTTTDATTSGNSEQEQSQDSGAMVNMSQEAFNALISDRVRRATSAVETKYTERFGVDNMDQVDSIISSHKEAQTAQMTELEKAQAANAELQKTLEASKKESNRVLLNNAVMLAAPTHEIPQDRMQALLKLMDLSTLKTENGQVSGVDDAIKKVIEENPFILLKSAEDNGQGRLNTQGTSTSTNNKAMQDALKKAAKESSKPKKPQFKM